MKIISLKLNKHFLSNKPNKEYIKPQDLVSEFEKNRLFLEHTQSTEASSFQTDKALESIYLLCELIQRFDLKTNFLDVQYFVGPNSKLTKTHTLSLNDLRNYFYHRIDANLIIDTSGLEFSSKSATLNEILELFNILSLNNTSDEHPINKKNSIIKQAIEFSINKFKNLNAKKYLITLINKAGNLENLFSSQSNIASISAAVCYHELENIAMHHVEKRNQQQLELDELVENKSFMDIFARTAESKLKKSIRDVKTFYAVSLELSTQNNKKAFAYCAARINGDKRFFDKISENFSYIYQLRNIFVDNQQILNNIKIFESGRNSTLPVQLLRHGHEELEYHQKLNSESECFFEMSCRPEYIINLKNKSKKFIEIFSSIKKQINYIAKLLKNYSDYNFDRDYQDHTYSKIKDLLHSVESGLFDIKKRNLRSLEEKTYLVNYIFTILGLISNLDAIIEGDFNPKVHQIINSYMNLFKGNLIGQWYDENHRFIRVKPILLTSEERYLHNIVLNCKRTAIEINKPTSTDDIELRYYPKGAIGCSRKFLLADGKDKNFKAIKMYTDEGFTHSLITSNDNNMDILIDISKHQKDEFGAYRQSIKFCWMFNGSFTVDSLMKKASEASIEIVEDEVKERLSI